MSYDKQLQKLFEMTGVQVASGTSAPQQQNPAAAVVTSPKTAYQNALERAQQKQEAIIAGASSEAARQEHLALRAPKRVANVNGVYYPNNQQLGNSRVVLPGQQAFTRLGTGFNTGYKAEAAQQGYSFATEMKNQAQAQYDAYVSSPEYTREKEKNLRLDMLDAYSAGETAGVVQPRQDQKEVELKTIVDFWKLQEIQAQIEAVSTQNMQEFLSWPKEDQEKMRLFNENRAGRLAYFSASADQANTRQAYENAERMGLARAAEMELAQKYGEDKVQRIAESLSWVQNRGKTETARKKASEVPDGFWPGVGATVAGRVANAAGAITGTMGQAQNLIIKPTGQYPTLDPNNLGNLPNVVGQALTGAVVENIRGENTTVLSEAAAMVYRSGMSAADSLIRAYMGGGVKGISRALIASSAFGNALAEYSAQGASPMEAVLMSTVDAGLEVLTEEIPLDRIIKQAEIDPAGLKEWLKETAKSAVIEMGEEGTNFIGSAIAQSVILKDKSEYNQNIAQLMMQGMSYQQAKAAADKDMVIQGAMTLIESALSGGMMGGASQAVGAARAKGKGMMLDRAGVTQDDINAAIRSGLAQDPGTVAYQVAQEMQQKLSKGQSLSQYDMGRLYQSSVMTGKTDNTTAKSDETGERIAQPSEQARNDSSVIGQNDNTGVQTDNTSVQSDNTVEQTPVVVAKDEVPLESLKPAVAESLKRMSEATGRTVRAYTKPAGETTVENGYFKDGEIWINTEGRLPHVQVFSHELTHSIENSRYYDDIRTIAFRELPKILDVDNLRKNTKAMYESTGQKVTKEDIDREIVAEYVADFLLADEQSILNMTRENRGIAKKVLNWIDGMLARFGNKKAQERVFLQNARSIYAKALNETRAHNTEKTQGQAQTNQQAAAQMDSQTVEAMDWTQIEVTDMESYRDSIEGQYRAGVMDEEEYQGYLDYFWEQEEEGNLKKRYSYAGQGARTADLNGLDMARQMEELEVSADTIRQQTGWFRGDDGKWRFEAGTGEQGTEIENKKTPSGVDGEEMISPDGDRKQRSISWYDYSKSFDQQVDDYKNGLIPKKDTLVVGATPKVFQDIGFNSLPMTINTTHVDYALNGTKDADHYLGEALLKQLPSALEKPVAVFTSKTKGNTSVVALLPFVQNWKQVVAPVVIDGFGNTNGVRIDSNSITSVYGKSNALSKLLLDALNDHANGNFSMLYWDKKEAMALLQRAGHQLSGWLIPDDGFINSIRDPKSPVKPRFENVTQSSQFKRWFGDWEKHPNTASKVVNPDGTPKVVYHGTNGKFHVFQSEKGEYWFSESDDYAEAMMEERGGGEVKAVYLNMKNPYNAKLLPGQFSDPSFERPILDYAKKNGYDGVIIENDTHDPMAKDTFYVVFNNTQIKSATENVGTFEGNNPDIRYSISPVGKVEEQAQEQQEKSIRERMDRKGREYLAGVERKMVNSIAQKLNVPYVAKRETLMPIMQKLSDTYLETGRINSETERELYDEALDQMLVINREFYDQYKDVKDWIRTVGLSISKHDQADIADFADFKKRAFGTVKIVKDGTPVDTAYRELREMAPELFPEKITHQADQLQRIYDVANSIAISKETLDEAYGKNAEEARQWYRNDMNTVMMEEVLPELKKVKRYADQTAAMEERENAFPKTEQEAAAAFESMKQARDEYEKIRGKKLIDPMTEEVIGKLLREEMSPEDLDSEKYAELDKEDILSIFEAKKKYEDFAKQISRYKRHVKGQLREEADRLLGDSIDWKDKKTGEQYARETMPRNVLDIVPDKQRAQEINRTYFEPVQIHEAEATRFKREQRDRVRNMNISTEVKKGDKISESAAVQIIGEAMDNMEQLRRQNGRMKYKNGLTMEQWQGVIDGVIAENPSLDPQKIQNNVEQFRVIYDELFQKMNEIRVRFGYEPVSYRKGYFPHFTEEGDTLLTRLGLGLGMDTKIDSLPTSINGLTSTFKPGIQWFGNTLERTGQKTTYDAVLGFDKYIEGVANVIYHTEDIQKLRALESQIRYRTTDEGIRKQVDAVRDDTRLTDEEKEDKISRIYEHGRFTLSNFANELMEYTNLLAGKKSRLDRTVEALMGRRIYTVMKNVEARLGANMIAGNIGSAMTNFIPLQQAAARMDRGLLLEGMWDSLRCMKQDDGFAALSDFLTNRRGSEALVKTNMEKVSDVLSKPMEWIDNFTSESIVRAAYRQNLRRGLSGSEAMHQADLFAAGVMADRSKGAMPTLFESRNPLIKAVTQFQLEVNNQFSEVFKDIPREMAEEGAAALVAVLLKYFLGAYLFNDVYEKFTGRRPAMDPFGILNDTVGDFTGYKLPNLWDAGEDLISGEGIDFTTEKVNGQKALQNLAENVAGQMPFSSVLYGGRIPVSSAIPSFDNLTKLNNEDIADDKKRDIALKEALKLGYVVSPLGYGQIQKTWKGVKTLLDGRTYSINDKGEKQLQYPVFKEDMTPGQVLQAAVMGRSSLPQARKWAEGGYKSLSAEQTAMYQDLIDAGTQDRVAYDLVLQMAEAEKKEEKKETKETNMLDVLLGRDLSAKTSENEEEKTQEEMEEAEKEKETEKKMKIIQNADINDDAKAVLYYSKVASEKEREIMDKLADEGADCAELAKTMMQIRDADKLEGEEKGIAKRKAITDSGLEDAFKAEIYYEKLASDDAQELMDKLEEDGADKAEVASVLMQIQDADVLKGAERSISMRNAIADSNLEEEHKLELYRKKISDDKEDEISQFRAAGMDLDTFIEVQNEYSRIKETGKKAGQQAQDFSYWLEKQKMTDRQKKTAKDCFTFYSMVPADAKYFNQAVEAGVDADKAYEVVNKMTALKPLPGRTSVSDGQKLRVIVDSGLSEKDMVQMVQSSSIGSTMKTRLPILLDNGVSIQKQLQFWEKIFDFDADGSGRLDQREVRACLDSFPGGNNNALEALLGITSSSGPAWTTAEKAAMWQSYNTQFSARKNPYDRKVGQKVKAEIKAASEKEEEPEKKETAQTSTVLPTWSTGNAELDRAMGLR